MVSNWKRYELSKFQFSPTLAAKPCLKTQRGLKRYHWCVHAADSHESRAQENLRDYSDIIRTTSITMIGWTINVNPVRRCFRKLHDKLSCNVITMMRSKNKRRQVIADFFMTIYNSRSWCPTCLVTFRWTWWIDSYC